MTAAGVEDGLDITEVSVGWLANRLAETRKEQPLKFLFSFSPFPVLLCTY